MFCEDNYGYVLPQDYLATSSSVQLKMLILSPKIYVII